MTRPADAGTPPPARNRIKRMVKPAIAVISLAGGGAGAGWWFGQGSYAASPAVPPDVPELVPRTDADGKALVLPPPSGAANGVASSRPAFDRRHYTATYHPIEAPFTSNLDQSASFVQLSLGVATYYDARVVDAIKAHEMALRSAVLLRLAQEPEARIVTPDGKAALQRDLAAVMNGVLVDRTGFGGIDNVYFTSLVVQ